MNITLVLLKCGVTLVSQTEQLDYEPSCHLIEPMTFSGETKITLKRWPAQCADDHILLRSEDLLTVCEPTEALVKTYLKKIGKTMADLKTEPKQVILNEEPDLGLGEPNFDDDYEPRYIEE